MSGVMMFALVADWFAQVEFHRQARLYMLDRLGDPSGVMVADETGILKKDKSAGAQRQYSGTVRPIEDCQLGVWGAGTGIPRSHSYDVPPTNSSCRAGACTPRPATFVHRLATSGSWPPSTVLN